MRVLVTRVQPQAQQWCEQLRAAGLDAVALPLIDIAPPHDVDAVRTAWRHLSDCAWLIFVSPSAIQGFFAARPPDGPPSQAWPAHTRVAVPGPGSEAALRRALDEAALAGAAITRPADDAAQLDSEHLWRALQEGVQGAAWSGQRVCIVGGADGDDRFQGRAWLADRLLGAGAEVSHLVAYRRGLPALDAAGLQCIQDALRRPPAHLWLFSSSLAIDHLQQLVAEQGWPALGGDSLALATHPRIAQRARAAGFGRVAQCQPTLRAVTEKLLELQSGSPT